MLLCEKGREMLFRLFPKVNPVGGGSSPAVIGTQQYLEVLDLHLLEPELDM